MPQISLRISGRDYDLACGQGEETRLLELAGYIDGKVADLRNGGAKGSDAQLLLMASLIIADELSDVKALGKDAAVANSAPSPGPMAAVLEAAALKLESLTAQLSAA